MFFHKKLLEHRFKSQVAKTYTKILENSNNYSEMEIEFIIRNVLNDKNMDRFIGAMKEHIPENDLYNVLSLLYSERYHKFIEAQNKADKIITDEFSKTLQLFRMNTDGAPN